MSRTYSPAKSLQPLQAPEVKGRFQGAVSPVAGLAQLAQAYLSSKMANETDARFADIGKRGRDAYSAEVRRVGETIMGRPDEVLPPDVAGPPQPGMPAGTPDQVAQALLSSYAPSLRRMGETAFKSNLDAQATMNLMKMFGQDNAPPPAVPAAAMPAAPTAPAGAPAVPRPEAAAWSPSAAMPNPSNPTRGAGTVAPNDADRRFILQQEWADPANRNNPGLLREMQLAGLVPGQAAPPAAAPAQTNLDALPTTPTPLEAYTRRQKYSKREAQAMMVSGNKAVADIGKRLFDGYEKAEQETLIKQPGRETLAAFPVTPVKIEDPNQPGREVVVDARNNDRVIGSVVPKPQGAAGRGGGAGRPMSATAQKELIQTDEAIQGGQAALTALAQARALNDSAMGFKGAGAVSSLGTLLPQSIRPAAVNATENLDNVLTSGALPQLKAIFGGMPTEGERKVLLEVQGSSNKSPAVRKEIFDRAEAAVKKRVAFQEEKAKSLRAGTYFTEGPAPPASDAPTPPAATGGEETWVRDSNGKLVRK